MSMSARPVTPMCEVPGRTGELGGGMAARSPGTPTARPGPHRPLSAQHRIRQLEQRIRPRGEAAVRLSAEGRQLLPRPIVFRRRLDPGLQPRRNERHGHRHHPWALWKKPGNDRAVAVSDHGATPDKTDDLRVSGQPTLSGKLRPAAEYALRSSFPLRRLPGRPGIPDEALRDDLAWTRDRRGCLGAASRTRSRLMLPLLPGKGVVTIGRSGS